MNQAKAPFWVSHPINTSILSVNIINAKQGFEGSLISRNVELSPQKPLKRSSDLQGWSVAEQYIDRARSESRLTTMTSFGFRFSVFAISIPQLRAHAGAVAGSRLVRRDLHSFCFSSVPPTAARPGSAPQATCYSAVLRIRATFKARLERCLGV